MGSSVPTPMSWSRYNLTFFSILSQGACRLVGVSLMISMYSPHMSNISPSHPIGYPCSPTVVRPRVRGLLLRGASSRKSKNRFFIACLLSYLRLNTVTPVSIAHPLDHSLSAFIICLQILPLGEFAK